MNKPPDGSDPPSGELFRFSQYIVQLLAGIDMRPEEYAEKVDLTREQLEKVYWLGYSRAASKDVFRRPTVKPPSPAGDWALDPEELIEIDLNDED